MRIRKHKKSHIVELADHSTWRIWPADLATTLLWSRHVDLDVVEIDHDVCSHALVDRATGLKVRVVDASASWPVELVRQSLGIAERLDLCTAIPERQRPNPQRIREP